MPRTDRQDARLSPVKPRLRRSNQSLAEFSSNPGELEFLRTEYETEARPSKYSEIDKFIFRYKKTKNLKTERLDMEVIKSLRFAKKTMKPTGTGMLDSDRKNRMQENKSLPNLSPLKMREEDKTKFTFTRKENDVTSQPLNIKMTKESSSHRRSVNFLPDINCINEISNMSSSNNKDEDFSEELSDSFSRNLELTSDLKFDYLENLVSRRKLKLKKGNKRSVSPNKRKFKKKNKPKKILMMKDLPDIVLAVNQTTLKTSI